MCQLVRAFSDAIRPMRTSCLWPSFLPKLGSPLHNTKPGVERCDIDVSSGWRIFLDCHWSCAESRDRRITVQHSVVSTQLRTTLVRVPDRSMIMLLSFFACLTSMFAPVSDSIHPDTMRSVRPLAKKVWGRCHNQQLLSSDQCAPHDSWRKTPPSLGAQRRRLAPCR